MKTAREFVDLVRLEFLMHRPYVWMGMMIQVVMTVGLVWGFGFFLPNITEGQALFLTTGAAAPGGVPGGLAGQTRAGVQQEVNGDLETLAQDVDAQAEALGRGGRIGVEQARRRLAEAI